MVLAFDSTGSFAKAVYGDASSQHAGQNGAIATSSPSVSTTMKGGRRKQSKKQRHSKKQRQSKRQRQSRRQRGGK